MDFDSDHAVQPQLFDDGLSEELVHRYAELRERLSRLYAAPVRHMPSIDDVLNELDEVQASVKALHARASDPQRY